MGLRGVVIAASMLAGLAAFASSTSSATRSTPPITDASLRSRIKHVFIIYQENQSFDHYFGSYPHADNLAGVSALLHGFRQYDPIGARWVTPFRITDPDVDSPDHSRLALIAKSDGGKMDRFVSVEESSSSKKGSGTQDQQRIGELTMSFYDCDTIPFLWRYAKSFVLYDHFFQGMWGPSTPGNIEIIAAQAGETQLARNPSEAPSPDQDGPGEPVVNSLDPPFGPYDVPPKSKVQLPQRYAAVPLTLNGAADRAATRDTGGVAEDLAQMARSGRAPVGWGWYQEGFTAENRPADLGYSAHHNAVQYFAYMRHNDVFWQHVHPTRALLSALQRGTLPEKSVSYIKGGNRNQFGWRPANPSPFIQANFLGDDDHPGIGDADRQVAESFVATWVNAIARSRYWRDSAIIITWDDAGGYYDHVSPPSFERCFDGHPCGDGPRLPFILISPYARSGAIVHDLGDTASVVKFVNRAFGLPPLSSLPDERPYLPQGPRDGEPRLTDLTGAFDPDRLAGRRRPIAASAAIIPDAEVNHFPASMNCRTLGIKPEFVPHSQEAPTNFAGLPQRSP